MRQKLSQLEYKYDKADQSGDPKERGTLKSTDEGSLSSWSDQFMQPPGLFIFVKEKNIYLVLKIYYIKKK